MADVNAVVENEDENENPELELLNDEVEVEEEEEAEEAPQFDKEKFQRQNRELGNIKRQNQKLNEDLNQTRSEISQIKELLTKRPQADNAQGRQEAKEVKDEADELLGSIEEYADDDLLPVSAVKKLVGKIGSIIKNANKGGDVDDLRDQLNAMREKLERVEGETSTTSAFRNASDLWDETYPEHEGQFKKFNSKAMMLARRELGAEGNTPEVIGLATGYLNALAKKSKSSGKSSDRDNTAMRKPATSTKGTASGKSGSAPAPDLDEVDVMDLRRYIMQNDANLM